MESNTSDNFKSFEQNKYRETERKFMALDSCMFEQYRQTADSITQIYISRLDDEYSLRVREITNTNGETRYNATLKDRGVLTETGLSRMEIETPISQEAFERYSCGSYPTLHKQRAELCDGVTIDWIEDSNTPLIEIENWQINEASSDFLSTFDDVLHERTGYSDADNEYIAHTLFSGTIERIPDVTVDEILRDIAAYQSTGIQKLVIGIGGRSGSGKSMLARELQDSIRSNLELGSSAAVVSTDDYHRGKEYLESAYGEPWTNWDEAIVYDTKALAGDISAWQKGESVSRRYFDFETEESVVAEPLPDSNILIVEGIHAASSDLRSQRHMYYEVPTPLSVSLGRDVKRLVDSDRSEAAMKSPEERLRYMLEIGEPTYQTIEQAKRNSFSGCARKLSNLAIKLSLKSDG